MAVRRPMLGGGSEVDGSELGREVAVDLEPDADFDEGRGRPRHGSFPSSIGRRSRIIARGPRRQPRRGCRYFILAIVYASSVMSASVSGRITSSMIGS